MSDIVTQLNFLLALGGVGALLASVILTYDLVTKRAFQSLVRTYGLFVALLTTLSGSVMAVIYSDVFGFIPCGLCWMQRVFLMPQVALLIGAIYFKDALFPRYGIILSALGLVISLYQHYLQMGGSEFVKCPVAGVGADCAKRIMFEFGFMTYPLLAASSFIFLIVIYTYLIKTRA